MVVESVQAMGFYQSSTVRATVGATIGATIGAREEQMGQLGRQIVVSSHTHLLLKQ